ncbi:CoA transferase [Nocardioides marmotae]|uniref:CoA transferase n=1 Tax=Nocardioides marmotae TaxID=2663857 RepID=UPI0012B5C59F|nr:CoA transferase [Nocardioides marmotae]MBC9733104.1 CoA transferase [Nocardioides marmotae]MTB84218.1 CoA transferase [Nocardioides marmotae]
MDTPADTAAGRWWAGSGPLDVERLAGEAVGEVCAAAADLAARRGSALGSITTTPALVAAAFAAPDHLRIDGREGEGWAPLSGFVEARDGWVRLHANYPHHAEALRSALEVEDRAQLTEAVAAMAAEDVEARVVGAGGIATVVRTAAAWAQHPHGAATAAEPWSTVEPHAERRPLPRTTGLPLDGVRVLDLTRVIAGPTCSQVLACLGADVLRLDPPHRPELIDQYLSNGMGKRSAEVDLATAGEEVRRLLTRADVVLLGYRPGSLARFGLDPGSLVERDPALVVGSLSAWGEEGPWGHRPGFDSIVQAASGIADAYGRDGRPGALPVQALDHATGYLLAARVLTLLARGRGGLVRVSLLGAARTLLDRPRPVAEPAGPVADLPVPTVTVDSPHGRLTVVPPPFLLDSRTAERAVGGYGTASLSWA